MIEYLLNTVTADRLLSLAALIAAFAACKYARATYVYQRKTWQQQKWVDLYLALDEAYDALDLFQVTFEHEFDDNPNDRAFSVEFHDEREKIIRLWRKAGSVAVIFPPSDELTFFLNLGIPTAEAALDKKLLEHLMQALKYAHGKVTENNALLWDIRRTSTNPLLATWHRVVDRTQNGMKASR